MTCLKTLRNKKCSDTSSLHCFSEVILFPTGPLQFQCFNKSLTQRFQYLQTSKNNKVSNLFKLSKYMYISVAKLPCIRKMITCVLTVKLIVFVLPEKAFPWKTAQKYMICCSLLCIVDGFVVFPVAHSRLHVTQGKYHTRYWQY